MCSAVGCGSGNSSGFPVVAVLSSYHRSAIELVTLTVKLNSWCLVFGMAVVWFLYRVVWYGLGVVPRNLASSPFTQPF